MIPERLRLTKRTPIEVAWEGPSIPRELISLMRDVILQDMLEQVYHDYRVASLTDASDYRASESHTIEVMEALTTSTISVPGEYERTKALMRQFFSDYVSDIIPAPAAPEGGWTHNAFEAVCSARSKRHAPEIHFKGTAAQFAQFSGYVSSTCKDYIEQCVENCRNGARLGHCPGMVDETHLRQIVSDLIYHSPWLVFTLPGCEVISKGETHSLITGEEKFFSRLFPEV